MALQSEVPPDSQLFTAYLTNHHDNVPPVYTFGYIDQQLVGGGTINYAPVDSSQGFWQFPSTYSEVNGVRIPLVGNSAIADTGTTLALVDDATCKLIYAAIPGAYYNPNMGAYVFPTSVPTSSLPVVTFAIGNHPFTVHKEDLAFADAGQGLVFGGIQSRGSMTFDIFGDTCLKGMYAIFDQVTIPPSEPQIHVERLLTRLPGQKAFRLCSEAGSRIAIVSSVVCGACKSYLSDTTRVILDRKGRFWSFT